MSEENKKIFDELLKDPDWQMRYGGTTKHDGRAIPVFILERITDENRVTLQSMPDVTRISDFAGGKQTMFNIIIPEIIEE